MANNFTPVQAQKFQLAGSGCTSTATSIILQSFKLPDGSTNITLSNFGTIGYGTLEPGTPREESISFTGVTQNADGTATLTGVTRGLRFVTPYDEVTANKFQHAGGVFFVLSNTSAFYDKFLAAANDEVITGQYQFPTGSSYPTVGSSYSAPTSDTHIAPKKYVDDVAIAGAPDASTTVKGIVEEAVQSEVDAGTTTGGTGARLFQNPSTIRAKAYHDYAADSVGTDSYAITITPAITAYATGQVFTFRAGTANTGAATLNVSGLGAKTIKKQQGLDLETGDIRANQIVVVVYDGTNMQMVSDLGKVKISQDGSEIYAADSVGTDSYAVTLNPVPSAYVTGMKVRFKAGTANTGTATLNVNSLGAKTIVKAYNTTLADNDIKAGQIVEVVYDSVGDNFQMVSQLGNAVLTVANKKVHLNATAVSVSNTTSETSLVSFTLPGGSLSTNNALRVRCQITELQNSAVNPTLTLRFKYGATTMITTSSIAVGGGGTILVGFLEFLLFANASASSQVSSYTLMVGEKTITFGSTLRNGFLNEVNGTASETSSSDQTVAITAQWTSNNAGTITVDDVIAELIAA